MILWLSSYPKSGNTWARIFLTNYLFEETDNPFGNIDKINSYPRKKYFNFLEKKDFTTLTERENSFKQYILSQEKINLNGELNLLKSHSFCGALNSNNFSNSNNTAGFIYFVRDPRSVAISLAHHNSDTIENVVKMMINKNKSISIKLDSVNFIITDKYESMKKNPYESFKSMLNFISKFKKIEINENKIHKIIKKCEFTNLQNFEKKKGFKERKGNDLFFRKGIVDEWKNRLPKNLNEQIKKEFKDEMDELGYL